MESRFHDVSDRSLYFTITYFRHYDANALSLDLNFQYFRLLLLSTALIDNFDMYLALTE